MDPIETSAARWVVRRNGASCEDVPDGRFERWYRADPGHAACYDAAAALWRQMNGIDGDALRVDVQRGLGRRAQRHRTLAALTLAACAAGLGSWLWMAAPSGELASATGEIRSLTLADGSRVLLDAESAIRTRFEGARREVVLVRGRARFDVAPDPARPFVVSTPQARATALGTRYDVSVLNPAATVVSVLEHRVRIDCVVCAAGTPPQELAQAQRALVGPPGISVAAFDPAQASSWTQRQLRLRDVTLAQAVAELARYTGVRAWISDAAGARRVSAVVSAERPDALRQLAEGAGARLRQAGNWAWISAD